MSSSNLIGPGQHVDHGYTPYDFTSPFFMSMNPEDKIEIGYSKAASRKKRTSPSKRDDNLVDEFADLLKFNQDLLKIDPMENDIKNWDEEIRMIDPHLTAEGSDGKATYVDGMFLKRKRSENERHGSKNQGNMKKSKMGHIQLDFDPDWTPEEDYWFRKLLRDPEILHGKDHSNFKMDSQNPLGIVKRSIKNFVPGNSSPNLDQFYLRTLQYPYYNSKNYGKTQIYKRSFGSYDQRFKWARNLVKNKSKSKMKEQLSALKQRKQKMNWILKNSHKNLPTNNPLHKKNYQPSLVGAFNKQHERLQKNQDKNKQTDPFYSTDLDEGLSHGLEYSSYGRTKAGFDWDLLMNEF